MIERDFTPRQLAAQRLYKRSCEQFVWPVRALYFAGGCALVFYLYGAQGRFNAPGQSPLGDVMLAGIVVAALIGAGSVWVETRAFDAVRRAGLLDESREIVRRTATTFAGENLAFGYSKNRRSDRGLLAVLLAAAALLVWFGTVFATQISERILTLLAFAFFFGYAIIIVASWNRPALSLDERGVFAHHRNLWPRLVRWRDIHSAHFCRWNNFHDGAEVFTIELKNAAGKTLLTLDAATFAGAPPGFEARFIAELRRHLNGQSADEI